MRWRPSTNLLRTLRFRLTLWNSFVVLVVGVAVLAALRLGIRYTLVAEADATLRDETQVLALAIDQLHPDREALIDELERVFQGHRDNDWFVELVDPNGATVYRSINVPDLSGLGTLPIQDKPAFGYVGSHRIVVRRLIGGSSTDYLLRLGMSLDYVERDVNRLTRGMLPVIIVLIVAAPLGGYLLARQATAPIRSIIDTTHRLRPSRLRERLALRGTGDELDQLSDTINRFLDVIAGYVQQHEEFVGNAAHELRSPLAAIRTGVDVGLSQPRSEEEYVELLEQVADECSRLDHLVNQLLCLAENDAGGGKVAIEPVELSGIVSRCVDVFEALAEEREIRLELALSEMRVAAEPNRLRQVVVNLLDNALKFTPSGGKVAVRLSVSSDGRFARLEVEDDGGGIAPEDLPRLFERFFRAERSRARCPGIGGTGLGLSICQRIVERFGGRISVRSPAHTPPNDGNPGTCVIVEWPLALAGSLTPSDIV
ncbi:MAG TPA: ATP-binding protein [Pirellulaceae bacterium]|nr:ATP-binding protein [Pirellulaceae bacterium]